NTSDSFELVGNGNNYGTFSYSALPITVGPFEGDETSVYELEATDLENPNCSTFNNFGPVDCIFVCELSNLAAEPILCTSDSTYSLQLQFDYEDISANGFEVFAQGMMIGTYNYADLPLEISDFPILPSSLVQLSICDTDNPNCCASVLYQAPDCSDGCNIYEVIATPFGCDQGEFLIELDLEYQNVGNLGFQVFGNGNNYGNFSYTDLPIILEGFNGDGETTYEFIAIDLLDNTCLNFTEVEPFDCTIDCEVSNLEATPICNDNEYSIEINFNYNNASAAGFMLNGNGTIYGTYDYADLPITVGPFDMSDSTYYEFVVTDMVNNNCSNFLDYGQVDCTTSSLESLVEMNTSISYDFIGEQIMIAFEEVLTIDARIEVYNAAGQQMLTDVLPKGDLNKVVDMTRFASGWYMVRLSNEEGQIAVPFVKAK
ncbi:MAG: T9SS type A sorting domain-containing protein, partial [Saprospiraceae bacterium]